MDIQKMDVKKIGVISTLFLAIMVGQAPAPEKPAG